MRTEKTCLSSLFFHTNVNILEECLQNNAKHVGIKLNLEKANRMQMV